MYDIDQFPPGKQSVVIFDLPVANSCPTGHVNVTDVPKAVSLFEAKAPSPGRKTGQSIIRNTKLNI